MAVNVTEVETVYNKFMNTDSGSEGLVLKSIQAEWEAGRIRDKEYATVYLGAIQSAMQLAIQSVQQQETVDADVDLKTKEGTIKDYQVTEVLPAEVAIKDYQLTNILPTDKASKEAQTALYVRQTAGFEDNKNQKLFESQLNAWGLMFSSGLLTEKPAIISGDAVSTLYNKLNNNNPPVINSITVAGSVYAGTAVSVLLSSPLTSIEVEATDADIGDTLNYLWTVTTAPASSTATIADPNAATTSFTPVVAGTYVLTIAVNDGVGSVSDTITLTVS